MVESWRKWKTKPKNALSKTKEVVYMLVLPLFVASILIYMGYKYFQLFPGEGNLIWRILLGYVPMGFAAVILIYSMGFFLFKMPGNSGKR